MYLPPQFDCRDARLAVHQALHARYAAGTPDEPTPAGWMRTLGLAGLGASEPVARG